MDYVLIIEPPNNVDKNKFEIAGASYEKACQTFLQLTTMPLDQVKLVVSLSSFNKRSTLAATLVIDQIIGSPAGLLFRYTNKEKMSVTCNELEHHLRNFYEDNGLLSPETPLPSCCLLSLEDFDKLLSTCKRISPILTDEFEQSDGSFLFLREVIPSKDGVLPGDFSWASVKKARHISIGQMAQGDVLVYGDFRNQGVDKIQIRGDDGQFEPIIVLDQEIKHFHSRTDSKIFGILNFENQLRLYNSDGSKIWERDLSAYWHDAEDFSSIGFDFHPQGKWGIVFKGKAAYIIVEENGNVEPVEVPETVEYIHHAAILPSPGKDFILIANNTIYHYQDNRWHQTIHYPEVENAHISKVVVYEDYLYLIYPRKLVIYKNFEYQTLIHLDAPSRRGKENRIFISKLLVIHENHLVKVCSQEGVLIDQIKFNAPVQHAYIHKDQLCVVLSQYQFYFQIESSKIPQTPSSTFNRTDLLHQVIDQGIIIDNDMSQLDIQRGYAKWKIWLSNNPQSEIFAEIYPVFDEFGPKIEVLRSPPGQWKIKSGAYKFGDKKTFNWCLQTEIFNFSEAIEYANNLVRIFEGLNPLPHQHPSVDETNQNSWQGVIQGANETLTSLDQKGIRITEYKNKRPTVSVNGFNCQNSQDILDFVVALKLAGIASKLFVVPDNKNPTENVQKNAKNIKDEEPYTIETEQNTFLVKFRKSKAPLRFRSSPTILKDKKANLAFIFGEVVKPQNRYALYCFDMATEKIIWRYKELECRGIELDKSNRRIEIGKPHNLKRDYIYLINYEGEILDTSPVNVYGLINLARSLQAKGETSRAIELYMEALDTGVGGSWRAGIYESLGLIAEQNGTIDEAIKYYRQAMEHSSYSNARERLAKLEGQN